MIQIKLKNLTYLLQFQCNSYKTLIIIIRSLKMVQI